jgi:hypothetical protein
VWKKPAIEARTNLDVEVTLQLAPDFVVGNVEENRREGVERLQIVANTLA